MKEPQEFRVASIQPFWRYAVVPESNEVPGLPFLTLTGAMRLYAESMKAVPWSRFWLIKRVWSWTSWLPHSEVTVLLEHWPEDDITGLQNNE